MTARQPTHRYGDALDLVWTACARRLGFRLGRSSEVYASADGRGLILLGSHEHLDADDSLAQMVLHELCHALVQGEAGRRQPDWGLDNTTSADLWREHACLRLQAWLTLPWGLRDFFAPTTDHRTDFWLRLPADDPFAGWPDEPAHAASARQAARRAACEASQPPWHAPLQEAFAATRAVADVLRGMATDELSAAAGIDCESSLPSLWSTVVPLPARHPVSGLPLHPGHDGVVPGCADCAWVFPHRSGLRCRRAGTASAARLEPGAGACLGFEPATALDCRRCAACCREAYDCVELEPGEALLEHRPDLVTERGGRLGLRRHDGHCIALAEDTPGTYACTVYRHRPRSCRDFTAGSANCLDARRRTGLSA